MYINTCMHTHDVAIFISLYSLSPSPPVPGAFFPQVLAGVLLAASRVRGQPILCLRRVVRGPLRAGGCTQGVGRKQVREKEWRTLSYHASRTTAVKLLGVEVLSGGCLICSRLVKDVSIFCGSRTRAVRSDMFSSMWWYSSVYCCLHFVVTLPPPPSLLSLRSAPLCLLLFATEVQHCCSVKSHIPPRCGVATYSSVINTP